MVDLILGKIAFEVPEERELLTYNDSLERLINAGYARHPSPSELMNLAIRNANGVSTKEETDAYRKMNIDTSESYWVSAVIKREGDNIIRIFENPRRIKPVQRYVTQPYDFSQMQFDSEREFSIMGDPYFYSNVDITARELSQRCPELVEYLWSANFENLPAQMQMHSMVMFPAPGKAWPMAFHQKYGGSPFSFGWPNLGFSIGVKESH